MKTALLCGYYGMKNLGDDLMLFCLQNWLGNQAVEATVLAENAEQVKAHQGFDALQNYPLLGQWNIRDSWFRGKVAGVVQRISSADLFIAGGGDIIRDELGVKGFSYQVEKLILAILLGKPVYLVNVGITKPCTAYGRAVLSWLLPRCTKIFVRDQRSVGLCAEYKARGIVHFLPDIVCGLAAMVPLPDPPAPHKPYLLVCLHGDANVHGRYDLSEDRIGRLAEAIDRYVDKNDIDVRFFACQTGATDDHEPHRRLIGKMRNNGRTVLHGWTSNPDEIAALFGNSSIVAGMRLHAGILAYAFQKPCVILPYDTKVTEFAAQADLPILNPEQLDSVETILAILNDARPSLNNSAAALWAAARLFD